MIFLTFSSRRWKVPVDRDVIEVELSDKYSISRSKSTFESQHLIAQSFCSISSESNSKLET